MAIENMNATKSNSLPQNKTQLRSSAASMGSGPHTTQGPQSNTPDMGPLHKCGQPTVHSTPLKCPQTECSAFRGNNTQGIPHSRTASRTTIHCTPCSSNLTNQNDYHTSRALQNYLQLDHKVLLLGLICILFTSQCGLAKTLPSRETRDIPQLGGLEYLQQFGYLPESDFETGGALRTEEELRQAVTQFQRFTGLPQTGELDANTAEMMRRPRCGMPDIEPESQSSGRRGRYVSNPKVTVTVTVNNRTQRISRRAMRTKRQSAPEIPKWHKFVITFRINSFTPDMVAYDVRNTIIQAFNHWARYTPLRFQEQHQGIADIMIMFASRYHGDGNSFDGPGQVLAHAYYPGIDQGGDLHFDEDETWSINSESGTNLLFVATHEIGHSLGLRHTRVHGAVMYPYYGGYDPNFDLRSDDIFRIQTIYGGPVNVRPTRPPPPTRPTQPQVPATVPTTTTTTPRPTLPYDGQGTWELQPGTPLPCNAKIDAVAEIRTELMIFSGKYFWRKNQYGMTPDSPIAISDFWKGLPKDIRKVDAVYEKPSDGHIIFIIGDKYWALRNNLDTSFRQQGRSITDFGFDRRDTHVDAAFVWGYNGKTYFFRDDMYWRYNEQRRQMDYGYPRNINKVWKGVQSPISSAFKHNGVTHFVYNIYNWEFNDAQMTTKSEPSIFAEEWSGTNCQHLNLLHSSASSKYSICQSLVILLSSMVWKLFI